MERNTDKLIAAILSEDFDYEEVRDLAQSMDRPINSFEMTIAVNEDQFIQMCLDAGFKEPNRLDIISFFKLVNNPNFKKQLQDEIMLEMGDVDSELHGYGFNEIIHNLRIDTADQEKSVVDFSPDFDIDDPTDMSISFDDDDFEDDEYDDEGCF